MFLLGIYVLIVIKVQIGVIHVHLLQIAHLVDYLNIIIQGFVLILVRIHFIQMILRYHAGNAIITVQVALDLLQINVVNVLLIISKYIICKEVILVHLHALQERILH